MEVAVRLRVFEGVIPILIGSPLTLYAHRFDTFHLLPPCSVSLSPALTPFFSISQPVVVARLRALLDPNTGAVTQKNPRCVAPNSIALVVLQVCGVRVCVLSKHKRLLSAAAARLLYDDFRRLSG
jgi:hypothetical protein